ncbi:hypothetical protein ACN4EE_05660 [Geminocystis sp. CENA526]|uniref:hypothetical protein n=1 Tax=Geminocystis sp. CENA526 TaxID=1355871 RepID=UPI003D6EE26A
MKSQLFSSVINFSLVAVSFSFLASPSIAQSSSSNFNQQQCIDGLVKEGLKPDQASVWCNYTRECLARSQREGLPLESARSVCNCTIKEFRKRYSTEKFREISKQADTNPKIARELREVGESCFEAILFE